MSAEIQQRRGNVAEPLMEKVAVPLLWLGIGYLLGRMGKPKASA